MLTHTSDTHRAEVTDDGILDIFLIKGRMIEELSFDGDTVQVTEHTAKSGAPVLTELLKVMDALPLLRAAYAGDGIFHTDHETGTQRSKSRISEDDLQILLQSYNFSVSAITEMLTLCKLDIHHELARVG